MDVLGLLKGAGAKMISALGDAIDKAFTNDEQRIKAHAILEQETNRHIEMMASLIQKEIELQITENANARQREVDVIKATGKHDYFMWFSGAVAILLFAGITVFLLNKPIPTGNEHVLINLIGLVEGVTLSIYGYYFSSSLGSRIKDNKTSVK